MKKFLSLVLFTAALFSATVSVADSMAGKITEDDVNALLATLNKATSNLDADAVSSALASDASITINITFQGKKEVLKPSKAEYIGMLKESWSLYKDYQYQRSNQTINIIDDQATVTADVSESMNIDGQVISGYSQEQAIIKKVGDKLVVIEIIANSKL